jgi:hypothetical protein
MKKPKRQRQPQPRKTLAKQIRAEADPAKRLALARTGRESTPELSLAQLWLFLAALRDGEAGFLGRLKKVQGKPAMLHGKEYFAHLTADGSEIMRDCARQFADRLLAADSDWFRRLADAIDFEKERLESYPASVDAPRAALTINETVAKTGQAYLPASADALMEMQRLIFKMPVAAGRRQPLRVGQIAGMVGQDIRAVRRIARELGCQKAPPGRPAKADKPPLPHPGT